MSRFSVVASIVAFVVLSAVLNLYLAAQQSGTSRSVTSFGTGALGHGALFDVLSELDVGEVERSLTPPRRLDTEQPLWLIEPGSFELELRGRAKDDLFDEVDAWIRRGGTAVILGAGAATASFFSLVPAPGDEGEADGEGEEEEEDDADADAQTRADRIGEALFGRWEEAPAPDDLGVLRFTGLRGCVDACARGRVLDLRRVETFRGPFAGDVVVRAALEGSPFVLEQARGAGRLVAVSSGRFLSNQRLGRSEGALIALDLVRAYGTPRIDETAHGLSEEIGLLDVLSGARLALLAIGLLGAGVATVFWQRRWPPRALAESESPEPSLDAFVRSLGHLYSKSSDYAALLDAYRRGVFYRLLALSPSRRLQSEADLRRSIEIDPALDPERRRRLLGEGPRPRSERDLCREVQALERYAQERA